MIQTGKLVPNDASMDESGSCSTLTRVASSQPVGEIQLGFRLPYFSLNGLTECAIAWASPN